MKILMKVRARDVFTKDLVTIGRYDGIIMEDCRLLKGTKSSPEYREIGKLSPDANGNDFWRFDVVAGKFDDLVITMEPE